MARPPSFVANHHDSGRGWFRGAIAQVNAAPAADVIRTNLVQNVSADGPPIAGR